MTMLPLVITAIAAALALVSLGGAFYEVSVVDPAWPRRPDIIQPGRGGVSRRRFWIPAHVAFELALIIALVLNWPAADIRLWLLVALASHAVMRIWSAFDFIPKALKFEKADTVREDVARDWVRRSRLRILLDLVTCSAILMALITAAQTA